MTQVTEELARLITRGEISELDAIIFLTVQVIASTWISLILLKKVLER